jgi:hypothetical protein
MIPLFDSDSLPRSHEQFEEGAVLLRGFATAEAHVLVEEVARIAQGAASRHLLTPILIGLRIDNIDAARSAVGQIIPPADRIHPADVVSASQIAGNRNG